MAVAAGSTIQDLCKESTCSICLDFFKDPLMITECGHNFCRACLSQCSGESDTEASCPQCRRTFQKRNLRPNRQLANIVEIARVLSGQWGRGAEGKGRACEKHQEPLKLFCRDHEAPICLVCNRAKEHKGHHMVPLEEASQEYQDLLHHRLESLREERERILAYKAEAEREKQEILAQIKTERKETVAQFWQMHQFLREKERHFLAQLDKLEKEISRKGGKHLARLSRELSSLEGIIQGMEKSWQLASELLQDVRIILQRSEKVPFENPGAFTEELKSRIRDFHDRNSFLKDLKWQWGGGHLPELLLKKGKSPERAIFTGGMWPGQGDLHTANVILDPDTANPSLILSENRKSVRTGGNIQNVPDNPERFSFHPIVLGCEGFSSRSHSWKVSVGRRGRWGVGVARQSVKRKCAVHFAPEGGFWVLRYSQGKYKACDCAYYDLFLSGELKKIWVSLNFDEEHVAFYDADQRTLLCVFSGVSSVRETLSPFFYVDNDAVLTIGS
ncbi:zinc finger protein RFP-like [Varanus komodoensis]|uniref:zinc finger protein RFP-like n=1 Tax=Varanus komodoensis TaxID=61221 RepID=UPI001CF77E75|nr:zinc finger protein RFP-like [Varanus komodoensis]